MTKHKRQIKGKRGSAREAKSIQRKKLEKAKIKEGKADKGHCTCDICVTRA